MRKIKSKNTGFERRIFSELQKRKVYFRRHYRGVIGNPDLAYPSLKRAVFLHSDFWHGWRLPQWEAVLPNVFWVKKLRRNRRRDRNVIRRLRRSGWAVLVIWEHQITRAPVASIERIAEFLIAPPSKR
ncbi:MAG: very short patch repair endonuclease [Reyranella sp.]|nr:very short patch repair endonuclease [Parvibaculum sp.]MCF8533580.1 very short patch repair endonuclease [Reyranella sp.]